MDFSDENEDFCHVAVNSWGLKWWCTPDRLGTGGFSDFFFAGSSQNEERIHNPNSAEGKNNTWESHFRLSDWFFYSNVFFMLGCQILEATTVMMTQPGVLTFIQPGLKDSNSNTTKRPKARDNPAPFSVDPYDFYGFSSLHIIHSLFLDACTPKVIYHMYLHI